MKVGEKCVFGQVLSSVSSQLAMRHQETLFLTPIQFQSKWFLIFVGSHRPFEDLMKTVHSLTNVYIFGQLCTDTQEHMYSEPD